MPQCLHLKAQMRPKSRVRVKIRAGAERDKAWSSLRSGAAKTLPMEGDDRPQKDVLWITFSGGPSLAVWVKDQLWQRSRVRVRKHITSGVAVFPFQW